jgi:hypothetical protein
MSDEEKKTAPQVAPAGGRLSDLMAGVSATSGPTSSGGRPKRRRKGQLNDGEWAPGYGPDAKKK